jgi:hypothetical protein
MLKRKGQIVESVASGSPARFTHGEQEAYTAAFKTIQPEFDVIRQIQREVRSFQQTTWKLREGLSDAIAIVTVEGIEWHAQAPLLRLPKCAVFLCRHPTENEFAIIHLFPAESAYAKANGQDQVLLRNSNLRQLVGEYAACVQHTLRFMASNLVARAQRVAWEQFPEQSPGKVVRAISWRCYQVAGNRESVMDAERAGHTARQARGMRV